MYLQPVISGIYDVFSVPQKPRQSTSSLTENPLNFVSLISSPEGSVTRETAMLGIGEISRLSTTISELTERLASKLGDEFWRKIE